MFTHVRLYVSPLWRKPGIFLLLASLLFLRFPNLSAQTSISGTQIRNPITPVAALPSACTPYSTFYLTTTNTAYICTATNIFTPLATGTGGSGLPGQNGTPGYLFSNGTTVSWGNILTGGSGALDCVSTPGRCDVTSIVPLKNAANTWTGANDFHAALVRLPESTVAGLPPASSNTGREFMVTDGASTCDTTTGGGSTRVLVQSTGTSYVAPNCSTTGGGSGGASSTSQLTDFAITIANGTMTVQPGRIRFGTMSCTNFTSPATASITSMSGGNGVAKLYISSACALVMQYPNSLNVTWAITGMTAQPVTTPTVPFDGWYMADVYLGPSAITSISNKRAIAGMDATKAGTGIVEDCTLGLCLISTDPGVTPTLGGVNAYTGTQDNTAATTTKPSRTVSSDPSGSCSQANEVILSMASGNSFSCLPVTPPTCSATCSWHAMGGSGGGGGGGSMVYPGAGVPNSTGSAWGASYTVGTAANNLVQLTAGAKLPAVDGSLLTNLPSSGGSGGGSASQFVTTGNAQVITDSGDLIIAATTALPALPASACWDYEIVFITLLNANPASVKLWYGSGMSVGTDYSGGASLGVLSGGTTQQTAYSIRGQICNQSGSQNSQYATSFLLAGSNSGSQPSITPAYNVVTSTPYMTPWTVDTTANNLQIGLSWAGGDGIKVQSFRVWRTQ